MKIFQNIAFLGSFVKGAYNRGDEIIHQGRSLFVGQSRINLPVENLPETLQSEEPLENLEI